MYLVIHLYLGSQENIYGYMDYFTCACVHFELIKVIGVTVMPAPGIYMPLEMYFVNNDFHGCNPLSCVS